MQSIPKVRVRPRAGSLVAIALLAAMGCRSRPPTPAGPAHPVIVVGIDGAEWQIIRELWVKGKLPNLKRLADRGTATMLHTEYAMSPVIWTTIATGRPPRVHGITDFVVPTPQGDVPVASTLRRVPALWTMASTAGRRVAVVSWWASWPAERVNGVVVPDRATFDGPGGKGFPDSVSPAAAQPRFEALRRAALARPLVFGGNPVTAVRDQVTAELGSALAAERYDLLLVYFRGVDVASHLYWRYFHPEGFTGAPAADAAAHADEIPRVYEATDAAVGRILAASPQANVLVMSDHGFRRLHEEEVLVTLPFDTVLERLGYATRKGDGYDWPRTRVFTWGSSPSARFKKLRFALAGREAGGTVRPEERAGIQAALERDLRRVSWPGGQPVFRLRPPREREAAEGADLVVAMLTDGASDTLRLDGKPWPGVVSDVSRISGSHGLHTHGVFIAAGPDVLPNAPVRGIHIHDMAPTILFALGLPVADDFAGHAREELFTAEFRQAHPLRHVRTWGEPRPGRVTASAADAEMVKELKALGYLQ